MVEAMEIPKGFKITEVGIIPDEWALKKIGEVCQIFGRIGFRGYTVNDIVAEGNGAISISPSNIKDDKIEFKKCTYISWFKYEESPEIKIYNGDVLLVKTGSTFGKTAIVKNLPIKATVNPQLVVLKKIKIDNSFMSYMMGFKIVQNQITSAIVGGAIPTLSQQLVSKFKIPLPPTKAEQTAIAEALNDADALITELEKLIAKKKAIKQGAMQELLKPKEGWEAQKLGECVNVIGGGTPSSFNVSFWNGHINWFTPTEVGDKKYVYESVRKITEEGYANSSAKILPIGTVLLTSRAGIGDLGILMNEGCTNQGFQSLLAKENTDNEFIYYLMGTLKNQLHQNANGSTFLEISPGRLKQIEIAVPEKAEQTRIAQILSDFDTEIEALEKKLDKYKMLKQGMMQNLLTGKIRLI